MRKWIQKWQEVQGTSHWNVSLKFSLTDKNMQVKFEGGFTTSFCEILTVHPLLDHMWITLIFIWFLLNFFLFLCDFSFGSEPIWVILATGHITAISSFIFSVILKVSYSSLQTNQIRLFNFWENLRLANVLLDFIWPLNIRIISNSQLKKIQKTTFWNIKKTNVQQFHFEEALKFENTFYGYTIFNCWT